jgi:hypothetical protein
MPNSCFRHRLVNKSAIIGTCEQQQRKAAMIYDQSMGRFEFDVDGNRRPKSAKHVKSSSNDGESFYPAIFVVWGKSFILQL